MSAAILDTLKPAQRRLIEESRELASQLDGVFSPLIMERLEGDAAVAGLILRSGRIRVRTTGNQGTVKARSSGQRIAAARRNRDWTQQELADRSGIARANIARLEAGRHAPQVDTLKRVARALGTTIAALLAEPSFSVGDEDRDWLRFDTDEWGAALDVGDRGR